MVLILITTCPEFLKIKEISKEITDFLKMGLIEKDCSLDIQTILQ